MKNHKNFSSNFCYCTFLMIIIFAEPVASGIMAADVQEQELRLFYASAEGQKARALEVQLNNIKPNARIQTKIGEMYQLIYVQQLNSDKFLHLQSMNIFPTKLLIITPEKLSRITTAIK